MSQSGSHHRVKITVEGFGLLSQSSFVVEHSTMVQAVDRKGILAMEVGDRMFDVVTEWIDSVVDRPIPDPGPYDSYFYEPRGSWLSRFFHFLIRNSH